ncbi:MAG TPA: tetratricopeptide repeat protein [Phycisphaerae bacterium]|jgi:tetratricopeptide (TPR) repeat protein|nr:tetratricopeptide repeat protein [Phycisphaerae bacterium]HOB75003.1 tetratricopeptide repeat protein [Phycisphaerae bacterium]
MAQRLNKKLVVGLTIAAMVLMTICMFALIVVLPPPDPAPFVQQAKDFEAKKQYEQAAIAYNNAAERARRAMLNTSDSEKKARLRQDMTNYRILVGDMAYSAGQAGKALQAWRAVMREDPTNEAAQTRILNTYIDFYRLVGTADWPGLEQEARLLSEMNKEQPNPMGLGCWGLALTKQRGVKPENAAEGEKLLKQAFELKKSDPDLASYLAGWHLEEARMLLSSPRPQETYKQAEARIREAEDVYEQLKAHLPEDSKQASTAWLYRGRFYLELRNLLWIRLEMFRRGTTMGSSEPELLKQLDEADRKCLESLQQAAQLNSSDDRILCSMGDYWAFKPSTERDEAKRKSETESHQAQAIEAYKKAIHAAPDEFEAYLKLSNLYRRSSKLAEAGDVLQARVDRRISRGTHMEFRNRLFMLKIREELFDVRVAQAGGLPRDSEEFAAILKNLKEVQYSEYVNEAEGREENGVAKFMRGRLYMLEGNYPRALELMKQASTATRGSDIRVQLVLAQLYHLNNVPAMAVELLQELTRTTVPNHDVAWTLLATVQRDLGQLDQAQLSADRALKLNPQNREAMLILAGIYQARNNEAGLEAIRAKLNLPEQAADKAVQEAVALLQGSSEGEDDSARVEQAKAKIYEALKSDPTHFAALRTLAFLLAAKAEDSDAVKSAKSQELKAAFNNALATLDKRIADLTATQSAAGETEEYKRLDANRRNIRRLAAAAEGAREDMLQRLIEVVSHEDTPPYEKAISLAQLYVNAGENEKAIEQLRTAHQLRPQESAILEQMFNIALAKKETWPVAENECIPKLIELGATRAGGRFHRGRLALAKAETAARENNAAEVRVQADLARREVEAGLNEFPSYPDGYVLLGQAQFLLNLSEEAQQSLAKALELNPRHTSAVLLMYNLARFRGDEAQRQLYVRRLAELNPTHPIVLKERQEAEDQANPAGGIARREKIAQSNPQDLDNLLALAALYVQTNQADKARETYEKCRKLGPENLLVVDRYAAFLRQKSPPDPAAAAQLLQEAVQSMKEPRSKAGAQLMLARHLEELNNAGGENAPTDANVAAAYEAAAKIHEIPEVLLDIARFYERTQQPKEAEAKYRRAIAISGGDENTNANRQARWSLIQLLMNSPEDRFTEVDKEIVAYGEKFTDGYALIAHSQLAMITGRVSQAIEDMNNYIRQRPQDAMGFYRRGQMHYQRGAIALAIEDLRKAASLDPTGFNFGHRRALARCLAETNQPDLAVAQLNSILEDNRKTTGDMQQVVELETARQLVELHVGRQQWAAAEAVILPRSREPNSPNRVSWLAMLANLYSLQGDAARAIAATREAVEVTGMQLRSVMSLAELCLRMKRPQDLIQFVNQRVPEETRKQPLIRIKLAEAYAAAEQPAQAIEIYNQLLDGAGDDLAGVKAIAMSASANLKDGLATLKSRLAARPDDRSAKYAVALAQLMDSAGYEAGLQDMNALLASITGTDDKAKAEKILILEDLCRAVHAHKDLPTARKLYEQLVTLAPGNTMAQNNLAYLLLDSFKEPQKAMEHAELAVRSLPPGTSARDRALIIDTLGWAQVVVGNLDMGIARLRQAINLLQTVPADMGYTMAGTYYHLAEGYFRRSQASSGRTPQADREEAVLACRHAWRLLATAGPADPDNVRKNVQALAEKLGIPLEEQAPTTQAAQAQ